MFMSNTDRKPKGQHEKYKELEGVSKQIKRDISSLFKRLRHIKKSMKNYMKCDVCLKYFVKIKHEINGSDEKYYFECPYCGKKIFL